MQNNQIYYIGGSPCCGKSTIAELLHERYGFQYYKLDNDLEAFMEQMAEDGNSFAKRTLHLTPEEMWLRNPQELCMDEIQIYRGMIQYAEKKLVGYQQKGTVVTEGAGYMPELMKKKQVPPNRYVCITPAREFQLEEYAKRPWIDHILEGTGDKEKAFSNWMERDILFAVKMREAAAQFGYTNILVNGGKSVDDVFREVEILFGFRA